MRYPSGQPVRISTTVRDLSGALVNASALTLTVAKPDGTQQTYSTPVNDSTGAYHQDVPAADLSQLGHYQYAWTATGTGAGVAAGQLDVYDPFEVRVLSLQDAKDMLNIPQSNTTNDAEIDGWVASIESGLERFTGGPVINRSVTERAELMSFQTVINVRQRPLVSVTQIVSASGGMIDISAGLDLDVNAGTIRRQLGLPFYGPFFQWLPQVTVTYVAGWGTAVPPAFASFARIVIQHLWETQRGPVAMPMAGEQVVSVPFLGFAVPARALELLNGSQAGVPFACEAYI
jgi:hypothetical protein